MARQKNKRGIMSDVGDTVSNTFGIASNLTGVVADSLEVTREFLKPTLIEAREETLVTTVDAINGLKDMGMEPEQARTYLTTGRL